LHQKSADQAHSGHQLLKTVLVGAQQLPELFLEQPKHLDEFGVLPSQQLLFVVCNDHGHQFGHVSAQPRFQSE
jgi:hypothetical protein